MGSSRHQDSAPLRVWEQGKRNYRAEQKVPAAIAAEVLDILLSNPLKEWPQMDVADVLQTLRPELAWGTCNAYVSAALLIFVGEDWVEYAGKDDRQSQLWRVKG
jgi:hypothetical protein